MIRGSGQRGGGGKMMTTTMRIRPSESRKTSSSERGTINGVTAGKDGTVTATTSSNSSDRPPSGRFPAKQVSPSWYIYNTSQDMCTNTANIEAVVFTSLYPEEQAKSAATVLTISEEYVGGEFPRFLLPLRIFNP